MSDARKATEQEPTTHFGFQSVPESQKAQKVAEVFHSVASKYDLMNDVLSGGMHRLWKRFTIELSGVRPGNRVLDIAGGTGDLTRKFASLVGPSGEVVLADINDSMLKVGRDRLLDKGVAGNVCFVQADSEKLPFPDTLCDVVTIAFGLRNVTPRTTPCAPCCACSSRAAACWSWNSPNRPANCCRSSTTPIRSASCRWPAS